MKSEISDLYSDRFNNDLFNSLWVEAWGKEYPVDIQPYSSCTNSLLGVLLQKLKLDENSVVADFGCGTGGFSLWLSKQFNCRVVGIDKSKQGVEIAKRRAREWGLEKKVSFEESSFDNSGLCNDSVDSVVSIDALPFADDMEIAFQEVRRILSPEGTFIFTARELKKGSNSEVKFGHRFERALKNANFCDIKSEVRPQVSVLWRKVYDQWTKHEDELRCELSNATVDRLMGEVEAIGPLLEENRDWLLISARNES
jgi:ubiquinone/menaquinone biosynthesis C-methylase UbiE